MAHGRSSSKTHDWGTLVSAVWKGLNETAKRLASRETAEPLASGDETRWSWPSSSEFALDTVNAAVLRMPNQRSLDLVCDAVQKPQPPLNHPAPQCRAVTSRNESRRCESCGTS